MDGQIDGWTAEETPEGDRFKKNPHIYKVRTNWALPLWADPFTFPGYLIYTFGHLITHAVHRNSLWARVSVRGMSPPQHKCLLGWQPPHQVWPADRQPIPLCPTRWRIWNMLNMTNLFPSSHLSSPLIDCFIVFCLFLYDRLWLEWRV